MLTWEEFDRAMDGIWNEYEKKLDVPENTSHLDYYRIQKQAEEDYNRHFQVIYEMMPPGTPPWKEYGKKKD